MRGKEQSVTCDSCGRSVPRSKAVAFQKAISFGTELRNPENDVRFFERRKVYYCISCAKHRGIFERLKDQAARHRQY